MAINASDWSRRVELTGASPSSTLSGLVTLITEANLPSEIWSTALNGGGDLRVCTNSDGSGQLPLEVVDFDTVGETARLWTRFATYSSGARSLWLFYGKAGETQPAVTDTFGRNNVWQDMHVAYHGGDTTDVTGNGATLTLGGAGTTSNSFTYDGVNDLSTASVTGFSSPFTVFCVAEADVTSGTSNQRTFGVVDDSNSNRRALVSQQQGTTSRYNPHDGSTNVVVDETSAITANVTFYQIASDSGSSRFLNHDGTITTDSTSLTFGAGTLDTVNVGGRTSLGTPQANNYFDGSVFEAWIFDSAVSQNYSSSLYSNQSNPGTFWTTGTPEDTGISITGATASYFYTPINAVVDLTGEITVTGSTASYLYIPQSAVITLEGGITVTADTASYSYTPQNAIITLQGAITVTAATANYAYTAINAVVTVGTIPVDAVFSGTIKEQTFSDDEKTQTFSGSVVSQVFSGNIKENNF